jgi:hypothetical protein
MIPVPRPTSAHPIARTQAAFSTAARAMERALFCVFVAVGAVRPLGELVVDPALLGAVKHVASSIATEQVRWIDARWIVARVAYVDVWCQRDSLAPFVREAVCLHGTIAWPIAELERSVAALIDASGPGPATGFRAPNKLPKALLVTTAFVEPLSRGAIVLGHMRNIIHVGAA